MTPAERAKNVERCAEIVRQLNDPDWPGMDEQARAELAYELEHLRYERERQERLWRVG